MKHLISAVVACLTVLAMAGCATAAAEESVRIVKARGSLQCGSAGTAPEQMAEQLRAGGVTVLRSACAGDGRMRVAMCGAPDGRLNVFDIPRSQLPAARTLGFAEADASVREQPCR